MFIPLGEWSPRNEPVGQHAYLIPHRNLKKFTWGHHEDKLAAYISLLSSSISLASKWRQEYWRWRLKRNPAEPANWRRKRKKNFLFFLNLTPDFLRKNYDRNFSQKVFEIVKISSEFASKWLCGVNRVTKLSDGRFSQKNWPKGPVVGGICKKNKFRIVGSLFRKNLRAPITPMGSSRPRPCFWGLQFFSFTGLETTTKCP